MASDGEKNFQPIRPDNILSSEGSHDYEHEHGYPEDEIEKPGPLPNRSSTELHERPGLERTHTSKSARERREFEPITSGDRAELHRIASEFGGSAALTQTLSRTRTTETGGLERRDTLWGIQLGDPVLDPNSPEFDVYKWSRMLVALSCVATAYIIITNTKFLSSRLMRLMDENDVIQRRAGIVWKNLKVCGSGSAINIQKNVGSLLLAPLRFREFFQKGAEKTILNNFEGCLKSGEMLVVLGRPGSGCSTLLKTLMGELTGLDLKGQSDIHYNGKLMSTTFDLNFMRTTS